MEERRYEVPIVLIVFRKLETVKMIVEGLKKINPSKLYIIADAPRSGNTRMIKESYAFSKIAPLSRAVATWADRWKGCDFQMKSWSRVKTDKAFRKVFYSH